MKIYLLVFYSNGHISFFTLFLLCQTYTYSAEDLIDHGEIGRGSFGTVSKMLHRESGLEMAVKVS